MSPAYTVLRSISKEVDERFFAHYFRSAPFINILEELSQGIRQGRTIPYEGFANLRLPLPTLEEQRRIGDFLDEQVALLNRAIELRQGESLLREQRRSSALAGRFGVGEYLLDVLEGRRGNKHDWPSRKLGRVLRSTLTGGTPSTDHAAFWAQYDESGVPWVSIGDMVEGGTTTTTAKRLTADGVAQCGLVPAPPGTVLFAMYASVGKTSLLGQRAVWNQAILGLVPVVSLLPRYLLYWLELVRPVLPAIARSATQDNLNAEQVKAFRLPLPTVEDQSRLVEETARDDESDQLLHGLHERQLGLLQERKQALVTTAVTGRLDVTTARSSA